MANAKYLLMKLNLIYTGGSKVMKKVLMVAFALLISVAFVTTVFAQAKPEAKPAPAPAAAPEKAPAPEKKAEKAEKPKAEKAKSFKGEFVSMDAAAKTIVAKGEKGDMTFDVAGVKKMAEFKAGDKIMVSYMEKDGKMVAKTVVKTGSQERGSEKGSSQEGRSKAGSCTSSRTSTSSTSTSTSKEVIRLYTSRGH